MKYLSARDLRNTPGLVREIAPDEDIVLLSNGRPVAILVGIDAEDLEETALAIRQARAQRAVARMRRRAAATGAGRLTSRRIDAEIRAVRSRRKRA